MALVILPCRGRWQGEALTEGCRPLDGATPLRHSLREFDGVTRLHQTPSPYRGGC